jgi:hypothetical protein
MKRLLVTILSILYMASATGATVHIHYCMGKLMSAGFVSKDDDRCKRCGMKKATQKKGCCKDEHKTYKTTDHQLAKASFDFSHHQFSLIHIPDYSVYCSHVFTAYTNKIVLAHAPPSYWRTYPIYLEVRNFRI